MVKQGQGRQLNHCIAFLMSVETLSSAAYVSWKRPSQRVAPGSLVHSSHSCAKGEVSCRPRGSSSTMWCCTALGTAVLVNGLNTVCFIFQQVLWLKAWYASLLFLLSGSFCAVTCLFQLSVCARTIWHGSPARQCGVLSRGKIINHNLDGEGVRDWFYFSSRADSSTGR